MNTRRLLAALLFALVSSGVMTWLLSRHLPNPTQNARPVATRQVVVASNTIPAGEPLSASSLTTVSWPATQPLRGSFSTVQELRGRVPILSIPSGEPILAHDLTSSGAVAGLSSSIPPGMRAVSVRASDDAETVAGFVIPGNHVDVIVTYRSEVDSTFVSSMVLQDICVLAVGRRVDPETEGKLRPDDAITLLVTPEAAARFAAAVSLGKVSFALRSGTDKSLNVGLNHVSLTPTIATLPNELAMTHARELLPIKQAPARGFTVETVTGGKSTTQTFQESQK